MRVAVYGSRVTIGPGILVLVVVVTVAVAAIVTRIERK
jgi:hypothetical protein